MTSNEAAGPLAGVPSSQVVENESITPATNANDTRVQPNLPRRYLLTGSRASYLEMGVPLYEASIKCDWDAAEAILKAIPNLVRYSITEKGETALHVAASAKGPKHVEDFVRNLVDMMNEEDLALENEDFNTALYLAAAAGNVETVKIMLNKNTNLIRYPGSGGKFLPLYAAVLFGHYDVVKYLFERSKDLRDEDGWNRLSRGLLVEKCVENDMFDVALQIVETYPELRRVTKENVLRVLAGKPEAFRETKSTIKGRAAKLGIYLYSKISSTYQLSGKKHSKSGSLGAPENLDQKTEASSDKISKIINSGKNRISLTFVMHQLSWKKHPKPDDLGGKSEASNETKAIVIWKTIKSVLTFISSKVGNCEKESKALPLLRAVWNDIIKLPKKDIDRILRGPPDSIKLDKLASGRAVEALQLQNLISEHLDKMRAISKNTLEEFTKQGTKPVSEKEIDQALPLQLQKLISAQIVSMHFDTQNIIKGTPDSLALELEKLIFEHIVILNENIQTIIKIKDKKTQVQRLQKVIFNHVLNIDKERRRITNKPAKDAYSSRVLFVAAEMGNTEFVVELIRLYPDLIWKVNDDNLSIFHIAVKHRHEGIYNLLYEIGSMKDLITHLSDPNGNNMLHLVGTSAKDVDDLSGVALHMQRELLWFEEVKNMIPPSYRNRKNKDGLTPHELFTTKHKDLVTESGQWMKETANQCMVVAALIATIVFAAAFTIPGGYDQNSGLPMFQSKATLIVFVVADAISLFSSSASILIFLAILTSRYAERDFQESLPKKLMFGIATLFLSITTMTIVFGVSFFVLYHKGLLWIPIIIGVLAVMPVLLYVKLQHALFIDVIRATYGSKYLFKPTKHVLYYETPKV